MNDRVTVKKQKKKMLAWEMKDCERREEHRTSRKKNRLSARDWLFSSRLKREVREETEYPWSREQREFQGDVFVRIYS